MSKINYFSEEGLRQELKHFKRRGYRGFAMNRPDKKRNKLSITEREIGGIPNSSEDIKQSHASAIETYIEHFVGL